MAQLPNAIQAHFALSHLITTSSHERERELQHYKGSREEVRPRCEVGIEQKCL